ncbi:MAG: cupin domain-containing protein [Phycisphaerales bacterium]|nr:cupin domain-containing protein [Phycisphaerae bacterium]NNF42616.1 cupin domain-containing protein [Phycisphaerales bacterium]NNM24650.1 cupin domain-containing protein [Phycisphaerales bacterium]
MAVTRKPAGPGDATSEASTIDVGRRLRALRKLYGVSQRELAKRAGVTNGTISLIEQNRVSPTIASIKKVIAGFPLSLPDFFSPDIDVGAKMFYTREEMPTIRAGEILIRQVGPRLEGRSLQVLHECYEPGADTGEVMLAHDGEEAGVVVRGTVEVTVGRQVRKLGPGESYYFPSRLPHRFRNQSAQVCEIVSVCTPPTF